jgi:hypothetical protein
MSTHHPKIQPDDEGVVVDGVIYTELGSALQDYPFHSREIIRNYEIGIKRDAGCPAREGCATGEA